MGNQVTNIDFAHARRVRLSHQQLEYPKNVIVHEEYVETPDGYVLFTRCYIPNDVNKNPKGMICYNHGYADHIDCLIHDLALEWCSKRGYIFFTHDHYGHGRSDGLYIHCDDFNRYAKHASYLHQKAKIKYSKLYNIPQNGYFLGGESMGGAICIHQALYESQVLNGDGKNNTKSNVYGAETFKDSLHFKTENKDEYLLNHTHESENSSIDNANNNNTNNTNDNINARNSRSTTSNNIKNNIINDISSINNNIEDKFGLNMNIRFNWNGMFLAAPMCAIDPQIRPSQWIETIFRHLVVPIAPKLRQAPSENMDPWLFSDESPNYPKTKWFENNLLKPNGKPRMVTARSFLDATDNIENNAKYVTMPFIVLHSKGDKVTNPQGSKMFYENAGTVEKVCVTLISSNTRYMNYAKTVRTTNLLNSELCRVHISSIIS